MHRRFIPDTPPLWYLYQGAQAQLVHAASCGGRRGGGREVVFKARWKGLKTNYGIRNSISREIQSNLEEQQVP